MSSVLFVSSKEDVHYMVFPDEDSDIKCQKMQGAETDILSLQKLSYETNHDTNIG